MLESVPIALVAVVLLKIVDYLWSVLSGSRDKTDVKIRDVEAQMKKDLDGLRLHFEKEHDKLEQRVERALSDINIKLTEIKSCIDRGSGIERPVSVCRDYVDKRVDVITKKLDHLINLFSKAEEGE